MAVVEVESSPPPITYTPLSAMKRGLLIGAGTLCVGLGVLGAILPGLPSTVFFLTAVACYARSSERLYRWLMAQPLAQRAVRHYAEYKRTKALPLRVKLIAMGAAWTSFALMAFVPNTAPWFVKWLVLIAALACSAFMLTRKTAR
jgi:hypothetical protein